MPYPRLLMDRRMKVRALPANRADIYAGAIGPDGKYWLLTYNSLMSSPDGITWTNVCDASSGTPAYNFYECEGLFVSSTGAIYVVHTNITGTQSRLLVSSDNGASFTPVLCGAGSTAFQFPVLHTSDLAKCGYFDPWGVWEIEDAREAVNGLQVGDIIVGLYHRGDYTNTVVAADATVGRVNGSPRNAFIYVIRAGRINADATSMWPTDAATSDITAAAVAQDWFRMWNTAQALIVRHIHHLSMGLDGNLYFTCGDARSSQYAFSITSVSNPNGAPRVLTSSISHGLRVGDTVQFQASYSGYAALGTQTIAAVASSTVATLGSNGNGAPASWGSGFVSGNAGCDIITPWAVGDTGDFYRFCRIRPGGGSAVQCIESTLSGYTAMFRRDDGQFVIGNDTGTVSPDGNDMPIKVYSPATGAIRTVYTAGAAYLDGPVWDIVGIHGDQHLVASIQQSGSAGIKVHGQLLESFDGGETWARIAISARNRYDPGWANYDRVFRDRRRRVPAGLVRVPVSHQPKFNNLNRLYSTLYLGGEGADPS